LTYDPPGLYDTPDLIFKKIPDGALYIENDMHKQYKSILLVTNAHKHKYHSQDRLLRRYKYKHVIASLMFTLKIQKNVKKHNSNINVDTYYKLIHIIRQCLHSNVSVESDMTYRCIDSE